MIYFVNSFAYIYSMSRTVGNDILIASEFHQYNYYYKKTFVSFVRITFLYNINSDYRETAFIYAITSAGVTFSITHACSMGELQQCGCRKNSPKPHVHANKVISVKQRARHDFPPNGVNSFPDQAFPMDDNSEFEWGGCGDNILYGYTMSKQLMENQARDGRSMIIEHNNEAGRLVS